MLQKSLWTLNILGKVLVAWHFYSTGLHRVYRYFLFSIFLTLARSALLYPFAATSLTYLKIWAVTAPLTWLAQVAVVLELYRLVLKHYQGIYSVGRRFFFGAVAIAAITSSLTVMFSASAGALSKHPLLYYFALIERGLVTSLGLFLLLLLGFVAWFPVPVSRNLLTHCLIYSFNFLVTNVVVLYWHAGGREAAGIGSAINLAVASVCSACWLFLMTREGEERTISLGLGRDPVRERHLLSQLDSLNDTLLRTARNK
jgi:hypothetical protein